MELARAGRIELAITEEILDEIASVLSTKFRVHNSVRKAGLEPQKAWQLPSCESDARAGRGARRASVCLVIRLLCQLPLPQPDNASARRPSCGLRGTGVT